MHLVPFAAFLSGNGEPVERFLQKARLPNACLEDPDTLVPSHAAAHFRELSAQSLGLPNIALDATRQLGIADLGELGRALFRAPTLAKLLTECRRLMHTQTTLAVMEMQQDDEGDVSFGHRISHPPKVGFWHSDLYLLQWTIKLVRLVDPDWSPTELRIRSSDTKPGRVAIEKLGARAARFGQHDTGFTVPAEMLALPLVKKAAASQEQYAGDEHLWSTGPGTTYAETVCQVIESYADDRWLSIEQTSEVTGTSVRSLQRRLAAEQATYTSVVEQARSRRAAAWLEGTDATVEEIATGLGYGSPGNFSRAFLRWAGVSPTEFRRQRKVP
jgi:AraC-like DNA-binding protein